MPSETQATPGGESPRRAGLERDPRTAGAKPPFRFTSAIVPRFRDTDAMGHINNAVYVTYLEVARQEYWKRVVDQPDYRLVPFILAHVTCDFRSEALLRETLEVFLRCDWIGGKSFAFAYEIRDQAAGRLVVEATTIQVCYDYTTKRSIPMPDGLRRALEAFEGRPLAKALEAR